MIDYLYEKFNTGVQYGTMAVTVSALSLHLRKGDQPSLGVNPLIKDFLRACFHNRPSHSRLYPEWKVSDVLAYCRTLVSLESLEISVLTTKTCMLVALALAARCQSLVSLSINPDSFRIESDCIRFVHTTLQKGSRPRNMKDTSILYKFNETAVDPVAHCLQYLAKTAELREASNHKLFITTRVPHKAASSRTISRWISDFISKACSCSTVRNAHSVRAVASSKAASSNVPLSVILAAVKWSSADVFKRFYQIPDPQEQTFQRSILQSTPPPSPEF